MKSIFVIILVAAAAAATFAQKTDDILATATGHTIRLRDLSAATQKDVANLPVSLPKARTGLLDQLVNQRASDAESKARGITTGKLMADEKAKVPNPTESEITTVLDANQRQLASFTPAEARKRVVAYLRSAPEQKALGDLFTQLKAKYRVTMGKNVNAPNLTPADIVATVNGQPITDREFEDYARIPLFQGKAELADVILDEVYEALYNALLADEAKSLGIDSSALIAREITDKLKEFSDAERNTITNDFAKRLFTKYQAKILYVQPDPPVENISVGNSPATGPANAPLTIVMFSDFQCSGKIRFVVRDFPLESIHEHSFRAALAAGAANAQGKFFEYTEVLYKHQDALDDESLKKYAAELGLNVKQFELDFNSEKTAAELRKDMADGESYGIGSTPTIFINGVRVLNISAEGFKAAIDKALGEK